MVLQQQIFTITAEEIEKGLDYIINHFDSTILYFPRTIMTKKLGYQKEVFSKQEALQYFWDSNFIDCRINAYRYSNSSYSAEQQQWNPDLVFIDIDRNNFKTEKKFELALSTTLENIKEKLNGYPTVLQSGNGCHIIQPIEGIIFESYHHNEILLFIENEFSNDFNLFNEFLKFAKDFLSNGKADKQNNPSLRSCLLRIPNSINSKCLDNKDKRLNNNFRVKILQKWNGIRPVVSNEYLEYFADYLIKKRITLSVNENSKSINKSNVKMNINYNNYANYYQWIEKLLETPIQDCRKLVLWKVLCPYLVNIRKLSNEKSFNLLREWLHKCNSKRELDFNPNQKIRDNLKYVGKFNPIGIQKLKTDADNINFYNLLKN